MNIGIIYDTKRNSTKQISQWLQKSLIVHGHQATITSIEDDPEFSYDLYFIGCPIYFEKPRGQMVEFLQAHREQIDSKPVALFILGWAKRVYGRMEGHITKNYFGPLIEQLPTAPISQHMFRGWIRSIDTTQEEEAASWVSEVLCLLPSQHPL